MRLSWPKDNNKKRALIGPSAAVMYSRQGADLFINTTRRDIERYRNLCLRVQLPHRFQPRSNLRLQSRPEADYMDLMQHCKLETGLHAIYGEVGSR